MLPISVVIPVYNAEEFLKETIDSVLNQKFTDFELIIADDSSTDRSKDIVFSYDDPRIRYVLCKHDFIGTHRKGYQLACGKYIAHLDHDDLMVPERLQIQFDFMESHPDIDACGGHIQRFGKISKLSYTPYYNHEDMAMYMVLGMPSFNSSGFFKREFLLKNKIRHQRGYSYAADFKFWTDIAKKGKLANIPEVLTHYRTSDKQASVVHFNKSMEASYVIRNEMAEFFLSKLKTDTDLGKTVSKKFLPAISKLGELGFFSADVYFRFMYELIYGLKLRNEILL
jgi:glycosyltransferase involved in cell wall biosynthesis